MTKNQFLPPKVRRPREELQKAVDQIDHMGYIVAGSWRRAKETVGDLDIVIPYESDFGVASEEFTTFFGYEPMREGAVKSEGIAQYNGSPLLLNLWRVQTQTALGAMLLYTTGPYDLNIMMRGNAKAKGWLLNDKGLFHEAEQLDDNTEESIFQKLGLPHLLPVERENWRDVLLTKPKRQHSAVGVTSSNGVDVYMVTIEDGKAVECECVGFGYRRKCRHLREAEAIYRA